MSSSVKVLVRVRPLLPRESGRSAVVTMASNQTTLTAPPGSVYSQKSPITYQFDESIWLFDPQHPNYTDNDALYNRTGAEILTHFFQGINTCLLVYGQTGLGKTYTMMGDGQNGLIPLIVQDVLRQKLRLVGHKVNCELRMLYVEIYNEQVKDLLGTNKCRVREHPATGPYVEGAQEHELASVEEFYAQLSKGNRARATAATSMNEQLSRLHAIITLSLKQTRFTGEDQAIGDADEEMVSTIRLVDLAGSERLAKTKTYGQHDRVKEGTLINKSLTVLGRCINALANNKPVVPYRDLILTYLLKENLGGNSKTFMVFCISPIDFEETYQTLNYANQVKRIKTLARANKTKLHAPVDWDELRAMDQLAIDLLKSEITHLTEKLNKLTNAQGNDKSIKLISYLESESAKLKFENKFLRQKLEERNAEIGELMGHIDYVEHELKMVVGRRRGDGARAQRQLAEVRELLGELHPLNVF